MLKALTLQNLLSYGKETTVELQELNVFIGANASGKSNLLEALALLRATPVSLMGAIRGGGGLSEWLWKGSKDTPMAKIEALIDYPSGIMPIRHTLKFTDVKGRLEIIDETIASERPLKEHQKQPYFFYRSEHGNPLLSYRTSPFGQAGTDTGRQPRTLQREDIDMTESVLSQRKDPEQLPELSYVANAYARIHVFRDWNLGRYTPPRLPQRADLPGDFLLEDASNLGMVLDNLEYRGQKNRILFELQKFCPTIEEINTRTYGGQIEIFARENGLAQPIPATRLSDGTLRYLCLLTMLCHPQPPPCVGMRPELGLHPDVIPELGKLLIEASTRSQWLVTTHSEALITALSEKPDSVVVCERGPEGSNPHRLSSKQLESWLDKYQLGELWRMGEIGGNRW